MEPAKQGVVRTKVERIQEFQGNDLNDLCDATESTILDDGLSFSIGLNRAEPPVRERLEAYWRGVLLVPERQLIIGRIDDTIASSVQLVKPSPNNQTSNFIGSVDHHFVAPWARGHGLARELLKAAERSARDAGLELLRLSVRASLEGAINLYEQLGYERWGTLDKYEKIEGKIIAGHFYYKDLLLKETKR